ncbi:hypothetical protein QUY26_37000 [Streptomyces flavofungini]|nr:hypothetical protein [Streptomyces flavofungini]WJV50611.1 hypothetical protein QUY26_37000 [Streptomyces flavofungini]
MLGEQLKSSTLPDLWDTRTPFQIDGNFGAMSGIVGMLSQSRHDAIEVLPALPASRPDGSVRGPRARGGATVDITWSAGRATHVALRASRTHELTLRCALVPGRRAHLQGGGGPPLRPPAPAVRGDDVGPGACPHAGPGPTSSDGHAVTRSRGHDPDGTTFTSAARTNATRWPNWIS